MLRRKSFLISIAVVLAFVFGGGALYWRFNGNTRPWGLQSYLKSVHGQTGERTFERFVFVAPPVIKLYSQGNSNEALKNTTIVETTTKGFTWKNVGDSANCDGELEFHARGRISREQAEKLGLRWTPFSSWQLW